MKYEHLLGRPFIYGKQDCYSMLRDIYRDNFEIVLPDYARPTRFWDHDIDLYMERYEECGFELVHESPRNFQPGDVSLVAIQSRFANHAVIHLGDGRIVHHFIQRLSEVCHYSGLWRNNTVATIRHQSLKDVPVDEQTIDFRALTRPLRG